MSQHGSVDRSNMYMLRVGLCKSTDRIVSSRKTPSITHTERTERLCLAHTPPPPPTHTHPAAAAAPHHPHLGVEGEEDEESNRPDTLLAELRCSAWAADLWKRVVTGGEGSSSREVSAEAE